ncbi:extracellular matrix organizing protein FRAS1-like [Patagioenas fasciata]|uniref:extracellular matrix organizing protein FRAS1-like n=1 Tax=Patagioenas fasciata TaxID=372321 RepID=UPI003A98E942
MPRWRGSENPSSSLRTVPARSGVCGPVCRRRRQREGAGAERHGPRAAGPAALKQRSRGKAARALGARAAPASPFASFSARVRFPIPIAFQQTNRPAPLACSLNTEFQLCNNEKVFLTDPTQSEMSVADYKGVFSKGQILYGRVLWNPEQNLNAAYKLQLEKVYLCTGKDGHVPFFDPTGTVCDEGPQYGCIQPNKHLKHRFLLLDRTQPEVTDQYFQDVPFDAHFASDLAEFRSVSSAPGVDGFTLRVDALYQESVKGQRLNGGVKAQNDPHDGTEV